MQTIPPKKLGRDRFFAVLREHSLLLEVKGMALTGRNQTWASGITYIRTDEGFVYLALVSDMWSRKIAGFHAGDIAEGALRALEQAV